MTGGYPPGAANDSRAPYNQPSVENIYHDSTEVEFWYDHGERSITKSINYQWTQIDEYSVEIWLERPTWDDGQSPDDFSEDIIQTISPLLRGLKIYSIHLL